MACVAAVRATLEPLPGVAEVEVDFPTKLATVKYNADRFDLNDALKQARFGGLRVDCCNNQLTVVLDMLMKGQEDFSWPFLFGGAP